MSVRKIALIGLILTTSGCATVSPYGSFLQDPAAVEPQIATDAVSQIAALYPPAKIRFAIQHPTPDPFGTALVAGLREQGYAIQEFNPKHAGGAQGGDTATAGLPLRYVLDQAGDPRLYRLTVLIGDQAISRPYKRAESGIVAAGYWARRQ